MVGRRQDRGEAGREQWGRRESADSRSIDRFADAAANLGVQVAVRSRIQKISRTAQSWEIVYAQDGELRTARADFIVDATGRSASIAKRLGARALVYDDLVGIVG